MEIFKTANKKASFICEALLGSCSKNGKEHNKICLVIVLRDDQNKAVDTVRYFLDIPAAKVLFYDIFHNSLRQDYTGYKKTEKGDRGIVISCQSQEGDIVYYFSILNIYKEKKREPVFFPMPNQTARELSNTVLDYIRNWEGAKALSDFFSFDSKPQALQGVYEKENIEIDPIETPEKKAIETRREKKGYEARLELPDISSPFWYNLLVPTEIIPPDFRNKCLTWWQLGTDESLFFTSSDNIFYKSPGWVKSRSEKEKREDLREVWVELVRVREDAEKTEKQKKEEKK